MNDPIIVNCEPLSCQLDGQTVLIELPTTYAHHIMGPSQQPCIHGPATFPRATLFDRVFVARLNFQAVFYDHNTPPIIASRQGNLVTLAINSHYPLKPHGGKPRCLNAKHRWVYRMHTMQWSDEQYPDDQLWLGIWPD